MSLSSTVGPDGTYEIELRCGSTVRLLTREEAYAHGGEVMAAVRRARYDAALYEQYLRIGLISSALALEEVRDVAATRPPLDRSALHPLRLMPALSDTGRPFLRMRVEGGVSGEWSVRDATLHALACVDLVEVVRLDNHYYQRMRTVMELDERAARCAVYDLGQARELKAEGV